MKFNLYVPIETRMSFLKHYDSQQHRTIQAECKHLKFSGGICIHCDYKCDHLDLFDNICLECASYIFTPNLAEDHVVRDDR